MPESNPPTILLALETSTARGQVALFENDQLRECRTLPAERRHASTLIPALRELVADFGAKPTEVASLAFSAGPGSFTGLRLAATVARVMHASVGCRVLAVPTLAALALAALDEPDCPQRVAAVLDARGEQLFCGLYERGPQGELRTLESAALRPAAWILEQAPPLGWVGSRLEKHAAPAGHWCASAALWTPSAAHVGRIGLQMLRLGQVCQPQEIIPLYLRPPECEEVYEARRAAARARRQPG